MRNAIPLYRSCLCSIILGLSVCCLPAQTPLTITLNPASPGRTIPSDFEGISFEMFTAVNVGTTDYPTSNAPVNDPSTAWFNSANSPLGAILQRLGVKNVRIGGVSTEVPTYFDKNATYPQQYDAAYVSDFVQQYGMELIWDLPVAGTYNLTTFTDFAQTMAAVQKSKGQNFQMTWEIGNEPEIHGVSTSTYNSRFDAYMGALRSAIGTSVLLTGPSEFASANYINALMADPDYDSSTAPYHANISAFSHHYYPISGNQALDDVIKNMLADNSTAYANNYKSWATTPVSYGYSARYDETNDSSGGGVSGASNTFAAALWGLDYLEFFAHNTTCAGLNFHEGVTTQYYAPFTPASLSSAYTVRGLGYGMLAFSTDGIGQVVPTSTSDNSLNVSAYGTLLSNGTETTVAINKTSVIAGDNTDVTLIIVPGKSYRTANVYYLRAPNNDPTQTTGITFGGGVITGNGNWGGGPAVFTVDVNGNFDIPLAASQAAVINMTN